jgi:AraC-like DNA-binding protein
MPSEEQDAVRRWSTRDVSQTKRLDYFAAALSEAVYPLGIDHADPHSFHFELSCARLGAIAVCKANGAPHRSFRGKSELARTETHTINFLLTLEASWKAEHRGALEMFPRDILIIDSRYPLRTRLDTSFTTVSAAVSDSWLRQWVPNPNLLAAQRIPGNSFWGHSLSSYVSKLSPELAAAPPLPLSVIVDQVGSLLAVTASGLQGTVLAYTPTLRSLRERIHECLIQRCTEPQLTATDVAACLGISARTLFRVFTAANETFGDKLIEARAQVALRMLTSRLFKRLTTSEIGRRAGFVSASHFVRVMRARTGRTPVELRRAAHSGVLEDEASGPGPEIS